MFTRSLAPYKSKGIRVNVLCPEVINATPIFLICGSDTYMKYIKI